MENVKKMVQSGHIVGQGVFDSFGKEDVIYFVKGKSE